MAALSSQRILALRAQRYRRTPGRRVRTLKDAERFVAEVGFCFFWPIQSVEMPSLLQAIAGREREVSPEHDDPDISLSWRWKDEALGHRRWYYGKLLNRRATLVSLEELPTFYALSENFGDEADYLLEYEAGRLTLEAKNIYEALRVHGPLDTVRLRREAHLTASNTKTRFDRSLTELQMGLKILPVGVAEAGAWHYSFVYDLVTRHYPDLAEQARPIARGAARARLVGQYLDNVVAARRADVARAFGVLGWTARELDATLAELEAAGRVVQAEVKGWPGQYYVAAQARPKRVTRS